MNTFSAQDAINAQDYQKEIDNDSFYNQSHKPRLYNPFQKFGLPVKNIIFF